MKYEDYVKSRYNMVKAELTSYGVCYNVDQSPFYQYRNGYIFYFSSCKHLDKFKELARIKEEWLSDSLSRRFHFDIDASVLADFQLYLQIEKRGFFVRDAISGKEYTCREQVVFEGLRPNLQDLEPQHDPGMQLLPN